MSALIYAPDFLKIIFAVAISFIAGFFVAYILPYQSINYSTKNLTKTEKTERRIYLFGIGVGLLLLLFIKIYLFLYLK